MNLYLIAPKQLSTDYLADRNGNYVLVSSESDIKEAITFDRSVWADENLIEDSLEVDFNSKQITFQTSEIDDVTETWNLRYYLVPVVTVNNANI